MAALAAQCRYLREEKNNAEISKKRFILCIIKNYPYLCTAFKKCTNMVAVVQLVRASDCGSECRGFESHLPPAKEEIQKNIPLFFAITLTPPENGSVENCSKTMHYPDY